MRAPSNNTNNHLLNANLAASGFRATRQRQQVYDVLIQKRDHPSAEDIFMRAKQTMPDISFATVYNCLDALVRCGLVRQVNLDRASARYCANMKEHVHFYCDNCRSVVDIEFPTGRPKIHIHAPEGFQISRYDISIRGICAECASNSASGPEMVAEPRGMARN